MSPLLTPPLPAVWLPQNPRPDFAFETHGRIEIASQAITSGRRMLSYFQAYRSQVFTKLTMHSHNTLAVTITAARLGLYTVAANGDLTLVCRSANDPTIGAAVNTEYARDLDATGGFPTSYRLVIGRIYAAALYITAGTPPQISGRTPLGLVSPLTVYPRVCGFDNSAGTDLNASITAANVSNVAVQPYLGGK